MTRSREETEPIRGSALHVAGAVVLEANQAVVDRQEASSSTISRIMAKDPVKAARRLAARPVLADMRQQRRALPSPLSELLGYVIKNLFDPGLGATKAWSAVGISDHTLSEAFRAATDFTLGRYIKHWRLVVADRMLRMGKGIHPTQVSWSVGISSYHTFAAGYEKLFGEKPEATYRKAGPPAIDYLEWRRGVYGELGPEEAWEFHQAWTRLYPSVDERLRQHYGQANADEPFFEYDGRRQEQLTAEGVWQKLRALPFEEQKRRVRGIKFHSTAFFDLLREKSREEGRRDRRRGIEVAELALANLEGSVKLFGERIHDLRALGWAWLGNAHVLALDFSAAEAAFVESDESWTRLRKHQDQRVLARICNLKGTFRMIQCRYDEGLALVERSRSIFGMMSDAHGEARALIQSASILGYSGRLKESIAALERAIELIDAQQDRYLAFSASTNLANAQVRQGRYGAASRNLSKAREYCEQLDHPAGWFEIDWVDGDLSEGLGELSQARQLYQRARTGFAEAREGVIVGLLDIDLAFICAQLGKWEEAVEHIAEALPLLANSRFGKETTAALKLLADSLEAGEVRRRVLRDARNLLRQDPITTLG